MDKKLNYTDTIIIAILLLSSVDSLWAHFTMGIELPFNNYFGFIGFGIVCLLYIIRIAWHRYALLCVLILYSIHIVDFSYKNFSMSSGSMIDESGFSLPRIVPFGVFLLGVHLISIWRKPINRFLSQTPLSQ